MRFDASVNQITGSAPERIGDCVTPVQARSELAWNKRFGPGIIWKEIWKDVARSFNDPLLRDFDWRTVLRVLPVNFRVHKWYSRISSACARCGERVETLEHTLIHCPMVKEMWVFILKLCNRIDASVHGLSERNMLLGCFPRTRTRDLLRYLNSVGKLKNECHISSKRMRKLTDLCQELRAKMIGNRKVYHGHGKL